ncbi:hypothetical protein HELRODRAFT_177202 [Helobdella robusta]|uniref:Uncharacterized protein n=1 Tax=Helobdella robusta TaxID=6412 RepID=T1FBC5_HELRO|nr:hypothetical protein HELRODRAFT_177202 [Helobdella robusta]ESN98317.1 hypothetical protein HELRODRAFT_177202 [Helobdella robusta]
MAASLKKQPNFSKICENLYIGDQMAMEQIPILDFTHILCVDKDMPHFNWMDTVKVHVSRTFFVPSLKKLTKGSHEDNLRTKSESHIYSQQNINKNQNEEEETDEHSQMRKNLQIDKRRRMSKMPKYPIAAHLKKTHSEKSQNKVVKRADSSQNDFFNEHSIFSEEAKDKTATSRKGKASKKASKRGSGTRSSLKMKLTTLPKKSDNSLSESINDVESSNSLSRPQSFLKKLNFSAENDNLASKFSASSRRENKGIYYQTLLFQGGPEGPLEEDILKDAVRWLKLYCTPDNKVLVASCHGFRKAGAVVLAFLFAHNLSKSFDECFHMLNCRRPVMMSVNLKTKLEKMYPRKIN